LSCGDSLFKVFLPGQAPKNSFRRIQSPFPPPDLTFSRVAVFESVVELNTLDCKVPIDKPLLLLHPTLRGGGYGVGRFFWDHTFRFRLFLGGFFVGYSGALGGVLLGSLLVGVGGDPFVGFFFFGWSWVVLGGFFFGSGLLLSFWGVFGVVFFWGFWGGGFERTFSFFLSSPN